MYKNLLSSFDLIVFDHTASKVSSMKILDIETLKFNLYLIRMLHLQLFSEIKHELSILLH